MHHSNDISSVVFLCWFLCMDGPVRYVKMFYEKHDSDLTIRPASLLCRFMAERASGRFSLASANSRDTSTPNSASSLQPPHFQPSPGGPLWWESQPHMVEVPSAQDRVTANATPAEAIAWTNADSLVAKEREKRKGKKREKENCISRDTFRTLWKADANVWWLVLAF